MGRWIIKYPAPVWSPSLQETNYIIIPYTQHEALRITTGLTGLNAEGTGILGSTICTVFR